MTSTVDRDTFSAGGAPQHARVSEYPAKMWSKEQARRASASGSGVIIASAPVVVDPHAFDVHLDVDATALAQFDCPTYDEATAVDLDGVEIAEEVEQHSAVPPQRAIPRVLAVTNGLETSFQSLLNSDVVVYIPPMQFDLEATIEGGDAQQPGEGDEAVYADPRRRCTYRKGRCSAPRTYKKNGELHSFCEFHRLRSIANQKNFDKKRRARTHSEGRDNCGGTPQRNHRNRRQQPHRPRRRSDASCKQNALQDDENDVKTDMPFFIHLGQVRQREGSSSSDNSDNVSNREPMWSVIL